MIFDAARLAFQNLFAAETRSVFWKVLGLTLLAVLIFDLLVLATIPGLRRALS